MGNGQLGESFMMTEFIIQNIVTGKVYDISELVSDIEWETYIGFDPGKLTFNMIADPNVKLDYGDIIRFKWDGKNVFYGKLFIKKKSADNLWEVVAYDKKRYLKNEDTVVFSAMTSDQKFAKICKDNDLPYRVLDKSGWRCPPVVEDKVAYTDMIQRALDLTLINYGMWYFIRDNFGTLEHISLNRLVTKLLIGDESLLTDFSYSGSIDDSFNQIKLTRDNEETQKREVYIVKDSKNIAYWGKLQYHETVDDKMNEAQIANQAAMLLKAKNAPKRTLELECLGDISISAGSGVTTQIADLDDEGFGKQQLCIVSKCTHSFSLFHTMTLEMRVV